MFFTPEYLHTIKAPHHLNQSLLEGEHKTSNASDRKGNLYV